MAATTSVLKHIPNSSLYVSEPPPSWFGNGPNPTSNPSWTNGNWLKSRFHFAFAEYRNHQNSNFGCLRVMNDDLVQPERGFGEHPHNDAEIMTYVVHGSLVHQDSMGNKGAVKRGGVQYMSAGHGVRHSEFNHEKVPLRFIQCWVTPSVRGVEPNYGQFDGNLVDRLEKVQHLASSVNNKDANTPIKVHQDMNLYVTEFSEVNKSVTFTLSAGRMIYLLCMEGEVSVGTNQGESSIIASKHDAVEMQGAKNDLIVTISSTKVEETEGGIPSAHVLFFEMKQDGKGGRSDKPDRVSPIV